jgi:hypothetical protein
MAVWIEKWNKAATNSVRSLEHEAADVLPGWQDRQGEGKHRHRLIPMGGWCGSFATVVGISLSITEAAAVFRITAPDA